MRNRTRLARVARRAAAMIGAMAIASALAVVPASGHASSSGHGGITCGTFYAARTNVAHFPDQYVRHYHHSGGNTQTRRFEWHEYSSSSAWSRWESPFGSQISDWGQTNGWPDDHYVNCQPL